MWRRAFPQRGYHDRTRVRAGRRADSGGAAAPNDAVWVKQEGGTDRRCFTQTRLRENVLLQAKVCQPGNGGTAVNVLAWAMQYTLGQ